ncbi:tetratricopeptide repeat-containing sensor histidine kinase [Larkinella humicola]|uniref:histidine kinase n=1 Tax=Larkinella humicola TaxID=2607654 RepID=A0A5N1JFN2_9BACT|nr:ATP-binding protein [Larkinella humicola]KAA9349946.1 hypothetical protein F0P93_21130 [Larkinella humicola]
MKTVLFPGLFMVMGLSAHCQTSQQLLTQLKTAQQDTTRLRLYTELSEAYRKNYQYDSLFFSAQQLLALASKRPHSDYTGLANYYLSVSYKEKKDLVQGKEALRKAVALLEKGGKTGRTPYAHLALVRMYSSDKEFKKSLALAHSSVATLERQNDPRSVLKMYKEMTSIYYTLDQNDSLYSTAQKYLRLATRLHSVYDLGFAHLNLGFYYLAKGVFSQAIEHHKQALRLHQQEKNAGEIAYHHMALGTTYGYNGDKQRSISHLLTSLTYLETRHTANTLNVYLMLVANYRGLNERMRALYTEKYMQLVKTTDDAILNANAYKLKAEIFEDQKQYGKALPYRIQGLKLMRKTQVPVYTLDALYWTAAALRNENRSSEALPYLKEALSLANQMQVTYWQCYVGQEMAKNLARLNQPQQALRAANQALAIAMKFDNAYDLSMAYATLTTVQEATGQYRQALATYKKYHAAKDSTNSVERAKQIARIQSQYDLEKKEATILLLNKNAQLQKLNAQQQQKELVIANQQRFALLLGMGALAFILGVIVFFLRQRTRQKRKIEIQAQQLGETNALKDQLFAIIGHDLRSPVASMKSSLMLIRLKNQPVEELDEMEYQVNGLYNTLDNLLYWSLNQREGIRVVSRSVNLSDIAYDVLESFEGMIRLKKLIVTADLEDFMVRMDENLTLLVFRNILHNALKFTPEGGAIRVSIRQEPTQIHLIVTDTGIGMDRNRVTQAATEERGTGLGLRISKDLMIRNGGWLSIDSQLGKGTTVTLSWQTGS